MVGRRGGVFLKFSFFLICQKTNVKLSRTSLQILFNLSRLHIYIIRDSNWIFCNNKYCICNRQYHDTY